MAFFEHFGPFIYFGQFVGLFPYRIETHGESKRFVFSWCHSLTVWATLSFVLQLILPLGAIIYFFFMIKEQEQFGLPKLINAILGIGITFQLVMIIINRAITFRYKTLRKAVDSLMAEIIKELEFKENFQQSKNLSKCQTFFGIVLILFSTNVNIIFQWIATHDTSTKYAGTLFTDLYFGGVVFFLMTNDCVLLMFHLSFYSIAYYVRLLNNTIRPGKNDDISSWKGHKQVLFHLFEAFDALQSIFSAPVLYIITSKLVVVSLNLFAVIYGFVKPNGVLNSNWFLLSLLVQVVINLAHLLIILHAADMPVYQLRYYREQIISNANSHLKRGVDEHLEVMSLLQHADEERFRLSAAGLFHVGMHLLPAVTGSIVTYLVILLQYQFNY